MNAMDDKVIYTFEEEKKEEKQWSWSLLLGAIIVQVTAPSVYVSFGVISLFFYRNVPFSWHHYWTPVIYTSTWLVSEPWFVQLCYKIENAVEYMYVCLVGVILTWLGLMLVVVSPFTQSHLVGLVGFLGGLGTSMCLTSVDCLLKTHFPKRLGVIRGFNQLMFALSMFIMPIVSYVIMDSYGRQGGVLLHSGIMMQGLVGAALLKIKDFEHNKQRPTLKLNSKTVNKLSETEVDKVEQRSWRNPGTEVRLPPPAPPNTPDTSQGFSFNSFSNNYNERLRPVIILNDKVYTGKDYRKHKATNLFGVEILPEISEAAEEEMSVTSDEEAESFSCTTANIVPKPARTFIQFQFDSNIEEPEEETKDESYQLICGLNKKAKCGYTEGHKMKYEEEFVTEDQRSDHLGDGDHIINMEQNETDDKAVSFNGNVPNWNKKNLKALKAQRFNTRLVYTPTTVDDISYTSDRFLPWQGRRNVLGGIRHNCHTYCCSSCSLSRRVDSDLISTLTTTSFIPVLFLLFSSQFSLMCFLTFVTHLVAVQNKGTIEDAAFTISLAGFCFLCFTVASPCFSIIKPKHHHIICVSALYLTSLSFYMLSVSISDEAIKVFSCFYGTCYAVVTMTSQTIMKQTFNPNQLLKTQTVFNPLIAFLTIIFSVLTGAFQSVNHFENIFKILSILQLSMGILWSLKICFRINLRRPK